MNDLKIILNNESGQGLVEYSLIMTLVAIMAISAIIVFGESVNELYKTIKENVLNAL